MAAQAKSLGKHRRQDRRSPPTARSSTFDASLGLDEVNQLLSALDGGGSAAQDSPPAGSGTGLRARRGNDHGDEEDEHEDDRDEGAREEGRCTEGGCEGRRPKGEAEGSARVTRKARVTKLHNGKEALAKSLAPALVAE